MSRFSDRLKLSVSAAALMGGSLIAASSARAVTITGTQTSASVTNVVDDVTIAGTGVISPNGLFVNSLIGDLVNNGLIEGEVTTAAALTSGSADFLIRTTAFDLNSGMTGDITNNGTIAASATGSASYTDAGAANPTHDSDALAHAIDINGGLVGDFTNNNDILSDASNSLTVTRGTEATPAGAPVNINDDVYANAQGVEIDSMTGTFTNTSPLTIASTADSSSSHSVVAQGGPADVDIIDLDVQATSTSVYIRGGTYAFDNEGTISAQASGDVGVDILAVATAGVADVDADVSRVYPQAYPVYLRGTVTGFTNSGTISGDLSSTADVNIVATGAAAADVDITNAVWGYLTTVHVRDLDGNFENSGTISATTDSSLQATVSASSANGAATIGVDDFASVGVYGGQYAVYIGSLDGTFTNSSALTIEGTSSGSADYDLSAQGASAVIDIEDVYVYQSMRAVEIDGGTYAVNNSGTISSTADSSATVNAAATGTDGLALIYVSQSNFASASGFHAGGTSVTDFSNSGTISSTAATDLAVVAAASGETQAYVTVDDYHYAYSRGVYIGSLDGGFSNTSPLTISADASSNATYDLSAAGDTAQVQIDDIDQTVTAYGVEIASGTYTIDNSGTISATAAGSTAITAAATVVPSETVGQSAYVGVSTLFAGIYAYGLDAGGSDTVTGFSNSGSITANASFVGSQNLIADGDTSATIYVDNSVYVTAYGVYVRSMQDDFDNSGTISATASADLAVVASASDASSEASVTVYDEDVQAYAYGVFLDDFNGTLTNSSPQSISAEASIVSSYDLDAAGPEASVSLETLSLTASAMGLFIDEGIYDIDNSGAISATASVDATVNADAVASTGYAEVDIDELDIFVYAAAIEADGTANSFANSGSITATGAATLTQSVSATGATSASADVDNDVTVEVYGVRMDDTLAGNFVNNGAISADASFNYAGTASSVQDAGPDFADINNDFYVTAVGAYVDFTEPMTGPLHSFTNGEGSSLTASGTLTVAQTVVAGAQDVPTDTMAAPSDTPTITTDANLTVIAGKLTGGLGTVTNSGTVAASGTVDSADADSMVVGLYLPDAEDGFVLTNSGDVSASLDGTTGTALVAAIKIGSEDTQQPAAETGEPEDPGLITINNSGTISASNTTAVGNAYGIDIMNAPEPVTINQSGGSIAGQTAIAMDQGTDDILNWTGGTIHGLVDADSGDVVNVFGGSLVMAPTDFAIDGVGVFNVGLPGVTPTTTPLPPVTTFMMLGAMSNTGTLNVNPLGNLYVGVPAAINVDEFNMNGDATYLTIDVQPGAMGSLSANGDANIDGTLVAAPKPGLYLDTETHTIITADADGSNAPAPTTGSTGSTTGTGTAQTAQTLDGVNGTFDGLMGDTLLLEFSSTINPTSVDLTYNRVPFDAVDGLSGNALSVAEGLEAGYDPTRVAGTGDPELNDVLSYLFVSNDADAYRDMLFSWAGSEHAQMIGAAVNLADPYFMAVSEHLNDTRFSDNQDMVVVNIRNGVGTTLTDPQASAGQSGSDKKASFWGRAFGRWSDQDGDINASGYDNDTYGVVIGLDYLVTDNVKIGIAAAYTDSDIDFDNGAEGEIERFTIGGYLSATVEQFYIDASFSYADDDYEVSRWGIYGGAACPTFDCVMSGINSDYNGDAFLVHGEIGYVFQPGNTGGGVVIQPFLGLNYSDVDIDSFTETGFGDLSLDVADGGGKSTQLRLGTRISTNWDTNSSTKVRPELRLEWRHEFENDPHSFDANLVGSPGIGFTTIGSEIADDLFVIGAGATAEFENGIGAFFEYQGAFGSGYDAHSLQLGARVKF